MHIQIILATHTCAHSNYTGYTYLCTFEYYTYLCTCISYLATHTCAYNYELHIPVHIHISLATSTCAHSNVIDSCTRKYLTSYPYLHIPVHNHISLSTRTCAHSNYDTYLCTFMSYRLPIPVHKYY